MAVPAALAIAPITTFMQPKAYPNPPQVEHSGGRPAPIPQPGPGRPDPDMKPPGKILSMQAGTDIMGSDLRSLTLDGADPDQRKTGAAA